MAESNRSLSFNIFSIYVLLYTLMNFLVWAIFTPLNIFTTSSGIMRIVICSLMAEMTCSAVDLLGALTAKFPTCLREYIFSPL